MKRAAVLLSPRVVREIDEAASWWAERGAPSLVDDALAAAMEFVQSFPEASPLIKCRGRWSKVRRASVEPLGYNLFYSYDAGARLILVRSFRHRSRRPPRL